MSETVQQLFDAFNSSQDLAGKKYEIPILKDGEEKTPIDVALGLKKQDEDQSKSQKAE